MKLRDILNEAKNDDKYVVIDFHEKGGGFVMTRPGSKKDAEDSARSIRKGSDISKREVLKVSDARKIRGLAGKNYLNEGKFRKEERDLKNLAGVIKIDLSEALEMLQEDGVLEAIDHLEIAVERLEDMIKDLKRKK